MSKSNIITPQELQRATGIGQRKQDAPPPTPDEMMEQFENSLTAALERDMSNQASVLTYAALRDGLYTAGLSKPTVALVLRKMKVGVSDNFVKHPRYASIITKFTKVMASLYFALQQQFGEEADEMMAAMVEDRFTLVVPL